MSTTSDPVAAEALGEEYATATFAGREWRVPRDVDTWPLDTIRRSLGVVTGRIVVSPAAMIESLEHILGDQWDAFITAAPTKRHLVPASNAFAACVGLPAGGSRDHTNALQDKAFGALPRLLAVIDAWPTAVESDLSRFWNLDYRDRWRFDLGGCRRLTLRQIYARISHLPADSALAIAMGQRSPVELLLMDLYEPMAGQRHPARPMTAAQLAERHEEATQKAKARAAYEARRVSQGHRSISGGLENARLNASRGKAAHGQET
ncbi:MAG: hypothetical protein WD072_03435 [Pirellulales bacterium]